ncbi:MAG: hypothetical protein M3354_08925 [Chloroflexota bacterium]|nr:hypothetical protein [Chloroflexota bacterium]
MNLPDLTNANNWIAVAAFLALVLSQFPPVLPQVLARFRGSTVLLSSQDSLALTHHLGRIYLLLHVQIENTGLAPVAISKVDCVLRRIATGESMPTRTVWRLPARTFYSESSTTFSGEGPPRLFIGTIHLKPGENWKEVVHCYGSRSSEDEEEAQKIQDRFASHIARELQERRASGTDDQRLIEVPDELVSEARKFMERMFDLTRGEYELYIAALDRYGKAISATKVKFIVYENTINVLRSIVEDYAYGFGVSAGSSPYKRTHVEPQLSLVGSGQTVLREYNDISAY